ncbi:cysteine proteinase [Ceraceosorus guamensis]|uniref:Ubiquitin carboxyl-terminal hydrolase n=1 Tax=Ceraceosorus guamensis TaxID=1522189 RepID=A0A316VYY5_9BASI|nr:cysteine proteinase [Ceraceosorus guamensis]PWN42720.1 cysteine proteinase [Ceraceosorus guamensis]
MQIGNACGTIGLLHAISNTQAVQAISTDSPLHKLLQSARPLSPHARAELLQSSRELATAHSAAASSGQSAAPAIEDAVDLHFVAFVRDAGGELAEFDGRRKGVVRRGVGVEKQQDLLQQAAHWIKENYVSKMRGSGPRPMPVFSFLFRIDICASSVFGMLISFPPFNPTRTFLEQMTLSPDSLNFNLIALGPAA